VEGRSNPGVERDGREGRAVAGRLSSRRALALDVKSLLTPPCIFHYRLSIQNIQGGVIMTVTSTPRRAVHKLLEPEGGLPAWLHREGWLAPRQPGRMRGRAVLTDAGVYNAIIPPCEQLFSRCMVARCDSAPSFGRFNSCGCQ
jgi:hypothetical protein